MVERRSFVVEVFCITSEAIPKEWRITILTAMFTVANPFFVTKGGISSPFKIASTVVPVM